MKRLLSLGGLCLCLLSFGCAEPSDTTATATSTESEAGAHLDKVDGPGLDTLLAENSINIVEFSAVW
jgi:hypothetical protein